MLNSIRLLVGTRAMSGKVLHFKEVHEVLLNSVR
jgi:hypothetical protein